MRIVTPIVYTVMLTGGGRIAQVDLHSRTRPPPPLLLAFPNCLSKILMLEASMRIMTIKGFSPRRMAYIVTVMIFGLLPIHGYVPCEQSGQIGMSSFILMILVGTLCMADPERKFLPLAISLVGVVANLLCTH